MRNNSISLRNMKKNFLHSSFSTPFFAEKICCEVVLQCASSKNTSSFLFTTKFQIQNIQFMSSGLKEITFSKTYNVESVTVWQLGCPSFSINQWEFRKNDIRPIRVWKCDHSKKNNNDSVETWGSVRVIDF